MGNSVATLSDAVLNKKEDVLAHETWHWYRQLLGEKHAETLRAQGRYATTLMELGRLEEAKEVWENHLRLCTEVIGFDTDAILTAKSNYGATLSELRLFDLAEPVQRESLELLRQSLGDDHPKTVLALGNYSSTLSHLCKYELELPLREELLAHRKRMLGEEHARTLEAYTNYAATLSHLGRHAEAEPLERKCLALRRRVLGESDPETLQSMSNLCITLGHLDRDHKAEALRLWSRCFELRKQVLGSEDKVTLQTMYNYCVALIETDDYKSAEALAGLCWKLHEQVYGEKNLLSRKAKITYEAVLGNIGQDELAQQKVEIKGIQDGLGWLGGALAPLPSTENSVTEVTGELPKVPREDRDSEPSPLPPPGWPYYMEFEVHIKATPLGPRRRLGLEFDVDQSSLPMVLEVFDGRVIDWNHGNPDQAVLPGDFLVQVNHQDFSSQLLAANPRVLSDQLALSLLFRRVFSIVDSVEI